MKLDRSEVREKILAIIKERGPVRLVVLKTLLGVEYGTVATAIQPLISNGVIVNVGRAKGYVINPGPEITVSEAPTKAPFVHMVEIPRATLKVIVQAHIDADTPMEGAFGKAMLCALKKLI